MKKIYSIFERLVCILVILLLGLIATVLFVEFNNEFALLVIAYVCITFIVVALLKLFCIPSHIVIEERCVKAFDFPLFATNKFYVKKNGLISYNREIDINEVEKIELIKLSKEEQEKHVGYIHLFGKYLKFTLKYGKSKYVYVGNYSNRQIKKIVEYAKTTFVDSEAAEN